MSASKRAFITTRIVPTDAASGFVSGEAALDRFFAQHAYPNDQRGFGSTFVLRRFGGGPSGKRCQYPVPVAWRNAARWTQIDFVAFSL